MIARPALSEYAPSYAGYVARVPEGDLLTLLSEQVPRIRALAAGVSHGMEGYRYAPGKWTVREVFGHLTDAERVFGHRCFCIARGERLPLPGFDENAYAAASGAALRPLAELVEELAAVRGGNLFLLRSFGDEAWQRSGNANGTQVSVRALAFILAGHVEHHLGILVDRYRLTA